MGIYTRAGDAGQTRLADGTGASKGDLRVEALGAVDELNAALGLALGLAEDPEVRAGAAAVQEQLFVVGAELASPMAQSRLDPGWVARFEGEIDAAEAALPPQRGWELPGGTPGAGALHVARTACRRAERAVVRVADSEGPSALLPYLNRLSDYLHVLSRLEAHHALVRRVAARVRAGLAATLGEEGATMGRDLSTAECDRMMAAAERRAAALGIPMVIAAVDAGGTLKAFKRMDGALLASVDIAVGKAYTSAALRRSTREVGALAQPGAALFGIEATNRGRIVTFGGGFPIVRDNQAVGGLGVSGGSVEQDEDVAQAGLAALG